MLKSSTIILFLFSVVLSVLVSNRHREVRQLREDKTALQEGVTFFKTKDSLNAASALRVRQERDEFKAYNADLHKTIEDLNIKLRRVESASETRVETRYEVKVVIKDSLRLRDSVPEQIKCLSYSDAWIDIDGCFSMTDSVFTPVVETRDTIQQVVYRVPRKFLFFRYGTKGIRQTIVMKNPYSKPVYTEYIELK